MVTAARSRHVQVAKRHRRRHRLDDLAAPTRESQGEQPVTVETLCAGWRAALDAAQAALGAASNSLPPAELAADSRRLAAERASTLHLLKAVAREKGVSGRFLHLTPRTEARWLLGLPSAVTACIFNLDEVLIGSATLHAAAWMETFDELIWARTERSRGRFAPFDDFAPFDPVNDYRRHIHGKPRLEGVRDFLASRGISLPEGDAEDAPGTETINGLANRKNEVLRRRIEEHGVNAYEGSLHYLQIALDAGIHTAVVSASANTRTILERAGLAALIEECVDGNTMVAERLRRKPEPDTLLAACRRLGVEPQHAAAFETSPAGVAAARAGGFALVVGVDRTGHADALRAAGADLIILGLAELLVRRLAA